jgi:hypothetical protein
MRIACPKRLVGDYKVWKGSLQLSARQALAALLSSGG